MNKQQLDERIEDIFDSLPSDASVTFEAEINLEREIKQLISDVLDEVVPEKIDGVIDLGSYHEDDVSQIDEDALVIITYRKGHNAAITTITDKRKELGV